MRKVLSFVLVLALVLSSFSMAFAADTNIKAGLSDISGNANEVAIQVAYDLGIITGNPDGTYQPEKTVTRAEYAVLIVKALAIPDSALAGYKTSKFTDTSGYAWAVPYLAFCEAKGIMAGYGDGTVRPGNTITPNEAVSMSLRAIGYVPTSAELVGSWPSNYVTLAQNKGLYEDVTNATTVNKANAAQIIYNTLPVQKVAVDTDGATKFLTIGKTTAGADIAANLYNTGLGCTYNYGIIDLSDASRISLIKYVGAKADYYTDSKGYIVAVDPISTFLTGEFTSASKFVTTDDQEYNVRAAAQTMATNDAIVVNAQVASVGVPSLSTTIAAMNLMNGTGSPSSITIAAKVTGKTVESVYSVGAWINPTTEQVDADIQTEIAKKKVLGKSLPQDTDKNADYAMFDVIGGVKTLADIKGDHVVYVYTKNNVSTADIVRVAVGTEVVTGKITDEVTKNGDTYYVVDGKKYYAANATTSADLSGQAGSEFKFFLDAYGDIYDVEKISGTANTYGVVAATGTSGLDSGRAKIYTSDDETKLFNVSSKVNIPATGGAIGYGVNKDGVINATKAGLNATTAIMQSLTTLRVDNTTTYGITSDCKVFTITQAAASGSIEGASYGVSAPKSIDQNVDLTGPETGNFKFSYILNSKNQVVAMVVFDDNAKRNADSVFAVGNESGVGYNGDKDERLMKNTMIVNGEEIVKYSVDTVEQVVADDGLYVVQYNGDGFVKTARKVTNSMVVDGVTFVTKGGLGSGTVESVSADKNNITITGTGITSDTYGVSGKVIVYERILDTKGNFEKYQKSSVKSIQKGNKIELYDVLQGANKDDEIGYDVVIIDQN